jgi:hypothetical protein
MANDNLRNIRRWYLFSYALDHFNKKAANAYSGDLTKANMNVLYAIFTLTKDFPVYRLTGSRILKYLYQTKRAMQFKHLMRNLQELVDKDLIAKLKHPTGYDTYRITLIGEMQLRKFERFARMARPPKFN